MSTERVYYKQKSCYSIAIPVHSHNYHSTDRTWAMKSKHWWPIQGRRHTSSTPVHCHDHVIPLYILYIYLSIQDRC